MAAAVAFVRSRVTNAAARSCLINVSIDAASIDMDVDKLNEHLKTKDFFDAANQPKLTFKSSKVEAKGDNGLTVTGDLTLLGDGPHSRAGRPQGGGSARGRPSPNFPTDRPGSDQTR